MRETRFKDTEIGKIPEDWGVTILGDYSMIYRGGSPRPIEDYITKLAGGVNWIKIGDVKAGDKYITQTAEQIKPSGVAKSRMVFPGDFILSNSMSFGRPYILALEGCIHDGWLVIQNYQAEYNKDFLYYALGSEYVKEQYVSMAAGSSVQNLNKDKVANVVIITPPSLQEQSRIASALTSIDNLISSLDKLIEKKKNIKQGTMQQLLTGKKRLKGFTDPWVERKLGDSFSIIGNNTYSRDELSDSGTVRDVHYGDVLIKYGSVINATSAELPFIKGKENVSHPLMEGDIIMADTAEDETCGKVCEIRGVEDSLIEAGLHTIGLRPDGLYGPCFLGYYMNSSAFHDMLLPLMQGTKVTSISRTALMNVQMVIPPSITEQSEIAKVLVSMDSDITALESKKAKYEYIKQGMMQQLLTGKIRLV